MRNMSGLMAQLLATGEEEKAAEFTLQFMDFIRKHKLALVTLCKCKTDPLIKDTHHECAVCNSTTGQLVIADYREDESRIIRYTDAMLNVQLPPIQLRRVEDDADEKPPKKPEGPPIRELGGPRKPWGNRAMR